MSNDKYRPSPIGTAVGFPWVNKPDIKFNTDGVFKLDLTIDDPNEARLFKAMIDKAVEEALEERVQSLSAGERRKWSPYHPYVEEEDSEGNKTGGIKFQFRQNHTIKTKDGEEKKILVRIYDATDKATLAPVYAGATVRVMFKIRPMVIMSTKKAGVRLDFLKVQILKLAERGSSSAGGFGSVEGGYVDDGADDAPSFSAPADAAAATSPATSDY